jgi:hypothetical protein
MPSTGSEKLPYNVPRRRVGASRGAAWGEHTETLDGGVRDLAATHLYLAGAL